MSYRTIALGTLLVTLGCGEGSPSEQRSPVEPSTAPNAPDGSEGTPNGPGAGEGPGGGPSAPDTEAPGSGPSAGGSAGTPSGGAGASGEVPVGPPGGPGVSGAPAGEVPGAAGTPSGGVPSGGDGTVEPSGPVPVDPGAAGAAGGSAGAPGSPSEGTPVARHGQLRVDGNRIVDEGDQVVVLRGMGFGWDNWWPQYYNADVVGWLADDWCVDMVRPAMGIEPEGAYLETPEASTGRIRAVVDAAVARGLYVIIDWHAHDVHQAEATQFFSEMAASYGDRPNVIYEVFNEPDDETWPEVKAYAETVIAAIREHDPDNLVIVGSPEWDQRIDLVAQDPIESDANVVYSVHFYASTHDGWLRDRARDALGMGIPLLVSESSGSEAAGTGANDYVEWEAWFAFMDENDVSWIDYSISDKAGETISVLEPGAPASGGWDASQLTETGEYIREVLRGYCRNSVTP